MSALVPALGMALGHFVWQGALLWAATALALVFLRRSRPQARYAVLTCALLLGVVLPAVGVLRALPRATAPLDCSTLALAGGIGAPPQARVLALAPALTSSALALEARLRPFLPWMVLVWAGGAALLSLRLAAGLGWVRRLGSGGQPLTDPHWRHRTQELAARMGLTRKVRVRVCRSLQSPLTIGWWRPLVLLPSCLVTGMAPELLEALLAHELAHILRHDYLVNLLQSVVEVLLFYHPAVWWLSRRLREERELIADDLAARTLGEPRRLALALQELERFPFDPPNLALAAQGGLLMNRIRCLIQLQPRRLAWKPALSMLALNGLCLAGASLSGYQALSRPAVQAPGTRPEPPAAPSPVPVPPPAVSVPVAPAHASDTAFAIIHKGQAGMQASGGLADLEAVAKLRQRQDADMIWARRGDRSYVIQDPVLWARVKALQEPMARLEEQQRQVSDQMKAQEEQLKRLSEEMKVQADQMKASLEAPKALGNRTKALQQEASDLPMEALGRKMDELGREQERAARTVEHSLEQLISAAIANGTAHPMP